MPCAGYTGFRLELCSLGLPIREEPRYAKHTPANCQPFGRSDRPGAALSAVAICDAIRIGFLKQVAGKISSGRCLSPKYRKKSRHEALRMILNRDLNGYSPAQFLIEGGKFPAHFQRLFGSIRADQRRQWGRTNHGCSRNSWPAPPFCSMR